MVGWEVTVRKIATTSNNVHINMCTKLSEKNCSQEWWRSGWTIFTSTTIYSPTCLCAWNILSCFVQSKIFQDRFYTTTNFLLISLPCIRKSVIGCSTMTDLQERMNILNFKVPIITFMRTSLVFPTDMSSLWSCCLKCTKIKSWIGTNKQST